MGIVTSKISSTLEENQKKMVEIQKKNMENQMGRQLRVMQAANMAWSRDFVHWIAGVWSLAATGALFARFSHGTVPGPAKIPLVVLPIVGAYNYDLAYGTKSERIQKDMLKILHEEDHWFSKKDPEFKL